MRNLRHRNPDNASTNPLLFRSSSRLSRIALLTLFPVLNQYCTSMFLLHDFSSWETSLSQYVFYNHWNNNNNDKVEWVSRPQMVYMEGTVMRETKHRKQQRILEYVAPIEKNETRYAIPQPLCPFDHSDCYVAGTWQETNNMTCNSLHELMDLTLLQKNWSIVGKGGKRLVLQVEHVALKMFQYRVGRDEDFGPMTVELQRRDAVVHERFSSSSPYIVDMYGYCGTSAVYALGTGGPLQKNVLDQGPLAKSQLLQTAHDVAAAVADLHRADIVHSDLYGEQWINVQGKYQLTDFNLAKFLKRSKRTNATFPIRRDVVDNWFAPEVHKQQYTKENIGTNKMDIWNMGNIFYLILVGRPPFDGLGRHEVHDRMMKQHAKPEIPTELRNSKGFVVQTMISVIDMCLQEDPDVRPSAQEVADRLQKSMQLPVSYRKEAFNRFQRFPSVEERVKRYMSNWYVPPCPDDPTATLQYQIIRADDHNDTRPIVLVRELASNNNNYNHGDAHAPRIVEIDSEIRRDSIMMVDPTVLHDVSLPHAGYRADVLQTTLPILDSLHHKPLLMQWGDRVSLHLQQEEPHDATLAIPHLKKCRPVLSKTELERMTTSAAACYGSHDRPRRSDTGTMEPILWKLDSHRLLSPMEEALQVDKPWRDKQAKAVFRGKLTGHAMDANRRKLLVRGPMSQIEYCQSIQRCRFVFKHTNSTRLNARLTDLLEKPLDPTEIMEASGIQLMGDKMDYAEMLDYKVLVMLEGNDVSSGLRWALRSNSVVMMPPPTFSSWVLEELLQPWVHYIPLLDENFEDFEEKMQWVLDHDAEAERIAHRGSLWMQDLLEHPDAESENREIHKQILERYQQLLEPSDQLSLLMDSSRRRR